MDTAVLMEIENLRRASLAGLREKYREVFQEDTRCRNREHLFRRIAWRLRFCGTGFALAWPTPGRTEGGWAGQ